ncbi:hypothetical protein VB780_14065 [Leptolyngbya sp. CCNP1308]|uniref:hypothetical protein n=1 Tax=Leptolyngbya sp. CCNP1308 TaxID=3110255 RepID=UPI002B1F55C7|nr:hypothetical protein [Leptolyngbya sp. CCNP1308]MEA5449705.1 hypothetical protein [Leptolyngbya sp. CCNP1308]
MARKISLLMFTLVLVGAAGCGAGSSELSEAKAGFEAASAEAAADGVDMAVKLAYLDKVEAADVPEYVSLMDSLETECSESRKMIGGIARGMMKVDIEQGFEGTSHYESMLTLQDMLSSWDAPRPVECMQILQYYSQPAEE